MEPSSIGNNLYNKAAYVAAVGKDLAINAWGYVPEKEVIITAIAKAILNKYTQVAACGTAAVFSSYKIRTEFTSYVSANTVPDLSKPIMSTRIIQGTSGPIEEEYHVTKTVFHTDEYGETCAKDVPQYQMQYKGTKLGFIKENWKLPVFATACAVACVVRLLLP